MWRNPIQVLDGFAELLWRDWIDAKFWELTYPARVKISPSEPAHRFLERVFNHLKVEFLPAVYFGIMPVGPRRGFRSFLLGAAKEIEQAKDYSLLVSLASVDADFNEPKFRRFANLINTLLRVLLAGETQMLVGVRNNKPALKSVSTPYTGLSHPELWGEIRGGVNSVLAYVDGSDVGIIPPPEEIAPAFSERYQWPQMSFDHIRGMLEKAYYNQRYMVDPEGAYVKLSHFNPFTGLTLKVKSPGLFDPNYLDLLFILEVDLSLVDPSTYGTKPLIRKIPMVLDGSAGVGVRGVRVESGSDVRRELYMLGLAAFIYHDLVTAKEIRVEEISRAGRTRLIDEGSKPSWVYIPRVVRRKIVQPRLPISGRNPVPHRVTGHLRRRNVTQEHRLELAKFERETGLKILELLDRRPGYTFVRPHVVPSMEEVKTLPRFIHARLQSEVEQMMNEASRKESELVISVSTS